MRVRWHLTAGGKCGEHLIHRVAVRDRAAGDAWANFNCWRFWFHFRILRYRVSPASLSSDRAKTFFAPQPLRVRRANMRFGTEAPFREAVLFATISGSVGVPPSFKSVTK